MKNRSFLKFCIKNTIVITIVASLLVTTLYFLSPKQKANASIVTDSKSIDVLNSPSVFANNDLQITRTKAIYDFESSGEGANKVYFSYDWSQDHIIIKTNNDYDLSAYNLYLLW